MTESSAQLSRRAAIAFVLGSLFFAYAFALRVSPSVMVAELMRDFGVGAAILGNLSAFYLYAYSGLQIPVGLMLDRLGPRRLLSAAAGAVALGCILFAHSETLGIGYLGRLIIGAGCAFSWAGTLAIVNQWFPTRFALLAGLSQLIAMSGAVLGQAPLAVAVEAGGWRSTVLGLAVVGAVLAVALLLTLRDRPVRRALGPASAHRVRAVLLNPQTWLAAGFTLAVTGPLLAFGGLWGVPFLSTTYGLERTAAAGIASLVFVGNGVGAVLLGWWSDRIGRRKMPMAIAASVTAAAQLTILYVPGLPVAALSLLALLIGLGGSSLVLGFACGREHNSPANVGFTIGIINTASTGSGALFQPVIGWLLDLRWGGVVVEGARVYDVDTFRFALLTLPLTTLAGLALLAFIRETHARSAVAPP